MEMEMWNYGIKISNKFRFYTLFSGRMKDTQMRLRQPDNDKWTLLTTHLSKNMKILANNDVYQSETNDLWHRLQDARQVLSVYGIRCKAPVFL